MDDDVIDISNLSGDELQTYLRRLADYSSCPCTTCVAICDRPQKVALCNAYQLWLWERMQNRPPHAEE